jgi:hypothetical protein
VEEVLKPLRGRVAVRELVPNRTGMIWHSDHRPDNARKEDQSMGRIAQSSHRGVVLGYGAPAMRYGHEVERGFGVGSEVVFVFASGGTEESRRSYFGDIPCVWVTQEEVIAVLYQ